VPEPIKLTVEEKLTNHKTVRGILCEAIVPVADVLELKLPTDLTELNPTTGAKFYDQSETTVYCFSCYLKNGAVAEDIDAELIKRTLNNRIMQLKDEGGLPLLANKGIINTQSGNVEAPVQVTKIQVFPRNIAIYATMYVGV
jgi:hypothetical protein